MDKRVETLKAHPAAEAYRIMDADELVELTASIKANGLRDPITIGIVSADRWIVDGRNRAKACEIAGVAPDYEEIEFADEDALRAFVLDRNERRNITAGQKAMAHAILFPEPAKLRRKGSGSLVAKGQFSEALLSQARAVGKYAPTLVEKVRDGFPLNEAYEVAMTAKHAPDTDESLRRRLSSLAPDLMTIVQDGKMNIREGIAALDARIKQEDDLKKVATGNLARVVRSLYPGPATPDRMAEASFSKVDRRHWPPEMDAPLNAEMLLQCAAVLQSLAKRWTEGDAP